MRVACELCGEVADAVVRVEGDALAVTCAACTGTFAAAISPAAIASASTAAGPRCPKCEAPTTGDGPCPRCGIAPEHARSWRGRATEPPTASLGTAWESTLAAWSEEAVHERAAAVATATGDYAWLAARYRAIVRDRPDDAMARRQLERLSRRAEATLRATAAAPRRERATSARIPYAVVIAIVLVVAVGLLYARYALDQRDQESTGGRVQRIAPLPSRR